MMRVVEGGGEDTHGRQGEMHSAPREKRESGAKTRGRTGGGDRQTETVSINEAKLTPKGEEGKDDQVCQLRCAHAPSGVRTK